MSPIELIVLWATFLCSGIQYFDDNTTILRPQKPVIYGETVEKPENGNL